MHICVCERERERPLLRRRDSRRPLLALHPSHALPAKERERDVLWQQQQQQKHGNVTLALVRCRDVTRSQQPTEAEREREREGELSHMIALSVYRVEIVEGPLFLFYIQRNNIRQ